MVVPIPTLPFKKVADRLFVPNTSKGNLGEVVPIPTLPPITTSDPAAAVVPMATFPWTARPLFKEAGKVAKP